MTLAFLGLVSAMISERMSVPAGSEAAGEFIDDALAGDDGGNRRAREGAGVERRVARFAGGLLYVIGPREIAGKNG